MKDIYIRRSMIRNSLVLCRYFRNSPNITTSTSNLNIDENLLFAYKELVTSNKVNYDDRQYSILKSLDRLNQYLTNYIPFHYAENLNQINNGNDDDKNNQLDIDKINVTNQLLDNKNNNNSSSSHNNELYNRIRGFYLYGNVGTGKTLLMDMFYYKCNVKKKRRVHFHKFMLEIHERIHFRKKELIELYGRSSNLNTSSERDAISYVASQVANEAWLLCFDEFQVTDICDAMILSKFFKVLWSKGTVLVATSNRPPIDLYKDGVNREYFMPYIEQLQRECIVKSIRSEEDYRQLATKSIPSTSFIPICNDSSLKLWNSFISFSNNSNNNNELLSIDNIDNINEIISGIIKSPIYIKNLSRNVKINVMMGRYITMPIVIKTKILNDKYINVGWIDFVTLCEHDRGAADYYAICSNFDIIYLHNIPELSVMQHDKARRFITFIDEVYDASVRLFWSSASDVNLLFRSLTDDELNDGFDSEQGLIGIDHSWKKPKVLNGGKAFSNTELIEMNHLKDEIKKVNIPDSFYINDDTRNFSIISKISYNL
jgi:protein AFG1